jgi:hypothetical protein
MQNSGFQSTGKINGCVLKYNFDEGSGTTCYDASGNNAYAVSPAESATSWVTGSDSVVFNGALYLPNTWCLMICASAQSPNFEANQIASVSLWFYVLQTPTASAFIINRSTNDLGLYVTTGMNLASFLNSSSSLVGAVELRKWYHVVWIYRSGSEESYLNGVFASTRVQARPAGSLAIILGKRVGAFEAMVGYVDDLRIYTRALTAKEVRMLYQGNPRGKY